MISQRLGLTPFNGKTLLKVMAIASLIFGAILVFAGAGFSQGRCGNLDHWSRTNPSINQAHIFCGEWSHNQPRGFHSRPGGRNPSTVQNFQMTQPANSQGIYGGTWHYVGQSNPRKFSTMFPDSCTQTQVVNSIVYAARNRQSCPANAPSWAWCGSNAPTANAANYCKGNGNHNRLFTIAGASLNDGRINTAFPLR
ncbi:MAG: hypothetical protein EA366_15435 [Spirulina sp. DLM2.Bin59]|nr:MAG: hypothetical protein EA366_15435 [Spirulina sp. DLM2.Bin59]